METVTINENGAFNADTIEIVYPDGKRTDHQFNEVDPYELQGILTNLGYNVNIVKFAFEHDAEQFSVSEGPVIHLE